MRDRATITAAQKFVPTQSLVLEVLLDLRDTLERTTREIKEAAERLDRQDRSIAAKVRRRA